MVQRMRIAVGGLLWLVLLVCGWLFVDHWQQGVVRRQLAPQLWRYSTGARHTYTLAPVEPVTLAVGDPIFVFETGSKPRQVGEIVRNTGEPAAMALLYADSPPLKPGAELHYQRTPKSMEWVLETMLPPEKRDAIARELAMVFEAHHREVLDAMRPIVDASLRDALLVIEEEVPLALLRHREQLQQLGDKYQREVVERELVPLVREEIWPIVQRRAEPTAERVGNEIWERASLWRFGWRLAYDGLPLTNRSLVRREWIRFVNQEAVPVLEQYTEEFVGVQQAILSDIARNERVQAKVRESLAQLLDDPELQEIAWNVTREVLVDNPRLRQVFYRHWAGPGAQRALAMASQRLQPTVERIGELLFGNPHEGITPEFARVLRHRILGKDRRWLVLHTPATVVQTQAAPSDTDANRRLVVRIGPEDAPNPFVHVP